MKKILVALVIFISLFFLIKRVWREEDRVVGLVSPEGVGVVSVSPLRGMVNVLKVSPEVELWFPGGMGWYAADRVEKIYDQGKQEKLIKEMFFYNFGIYPEVIIPVTKIDEWRNTTKFWKHLGLIESGRFWLEQSNWLLKTELINTNLLVKKEELDDILARDFAKADLLEKNLRVTVKNSSGENALGAFVADRLNWWGYNVVAVENDMVKDGCEVVSQGGDSTKDYADSLAKMFGCSQVSNQTLLPEELMLNPGKNYASMIKYNSYVRAF